MTVADKYTRLSRLYAVASGINEAIVRIPEERRLYDEACRIAVEQGGLMMAWAALLDAATGVLQPVASAGKNEGYVQAIRVTISGEEPQGQGPAGEAFRTGCPAVCNDIAAEPSRFASRTEALERGYRSCAAFPLKQSGAPCGVFVVYSGEVRYFNDEELRLLAGLADNFSFAIESRLKEEERARVEAQLRASESRLRALIDNEPECVKTVSAAGRLIEINPAGLRMVRATSAAELVGARVEDFVHPQDRASYLRLHQDVLSGVAGRLEFRGLCVDGTVVWMDTHAVPLAAPGGGDTCALYVTRDVTVQKESREKLLHSQALLAMASRLGRIGAWAVEADRGAVTWSDELGAICETPPGFSPCSLAEATGFIAPEHREPVSRVLGACLAQGTPFDVELEILTAAGRRVWVRSIGEAVRDAGGRVLRVQGALQDVSERKLAESEIRQLAQRLVTTVESVTDAFITVDRAWRFTYVNREAERLMKRPRQELLGQRMWDTHPEARNTPFEAAYAKAMHENQSVEVEAYFAPLGAWLEVRVYPSHQGLTIYFRDVSERRRVQEEILRLNGELEQRVRRRTAQLELANGELEAFSYSVAHDLRAPLAAIGGFAHVLEQEIAGTRSDKARHYLARIREGVRQTGEMIDAVLSLAGLSRAELRWEPVDLAEMARSAFDDCRRHDPQRAVVLHVQEPLPAQGDSRLLRLVMDNLVGNAWKFSAHSAPTEITVGSAPDADGQTVYFVRDNGVGFDMAYAGNLFGAFQRLHSQAEFAGTGIGLANVRRITSRHSGRIWAESAPGRGATFFFTLGDEAA